MKNAKGYLLITFSILCHSLVYSLPADTTSILDNIYNCDFRLASERLSKLNERDPLIVATLNLERSWWIAIESGNREQFSGFLTTLKQFENGSGNGLNEIISATYRMRYYACMNKNYMIPFLFLKIKKHIEDVDLVSLKASDQDGFELFILYKSFLTLVQNSLFSYTFLSDSHRNRELVKDIENIISNGALPNRTIGRYFLMKYYLDVKKDNSKALGYLTALHNQYPNNKVFSQLLIN
jgi:hypothetical protein